MTTSSEKPGRPLGLTLAIVLSLFLYSLLPLFQMGVQLFVQDRLSRIDTPVIFNGTEIQPLGAGGDTLIPPAEIIINGGSALVFLVIGILAWRGGRPWKRPLFTSAVLLYAGLTAYVTLRTLLAPVDFSQGASSADGLVWQALCGRLTATILVPLYVIWYVNRAPARAFYRGSYASEPPEPLGRA